MTKPARTTQAQIARAIRAAAKHGACAVEVKPDGTIKITLAAVEDEPKQLADKREIVL